MFVVFKNGVPIRSGNCPENKVELQANEDEVVLLWDAEKGDPTLWRLKDNVLILKELES
jgi:hypothetical protein